MHTFAFHPIPFGVQEALQDLVPLLECLIHDVSSSVVLLLLLLKQTNEWAKPKPQLSNTWLGVEGTSLIFLVSNFLRQKSSLLTVSSAGLSTTSVPYLLL